MKSIKPGRGPSAMGAMGSVVAIIFGIFWTIMAASMGAPLFFPIFGVIFILLGVVQAVYHFKNATGKERFSEFDIVDSQEEPDPLERRFGQEREGLTMRIRRCSGTSRRLERNSATAPTAGPRRSRALSTAPSAAGSCPDR